MAARKKRDAPAPAPRRRTAALAFDAISVEGGLLSPEWLARVAQLGAGRQTEDDYGILKGLHLRDEIGRYWRIAQALWAEFAIGRTAGADPHALSERFVTSLLRDCFGFATLAKTPAIVLEERTFPIGHQALAGRVPVVIASAGVGLDERSAELGDLGRRRSAFGLAQEWLNAAEHAHWGVVSDGVTFRTLRDNASLTRPAWIEADLQRIFSEERYADFAALWLLAHETRFGIEGAAPTDSPLETWREAGREEGTRAREHLRRGVEEALLSLGQGFLTHPDNTALRSALRDGAVSRDAYFQELLRLVYRLIFLLTVEERGLLHPDSATDPAKARYASGYSLRRLRERSIHRSALDRFHDLWDALKIVFRGVDRGEPAIGLPALAGLFAADQCPILDAAKLENRQLLSAIYKLAWLRDDGGLVRVNWRDMGPEELGSVYESLLELVPRITEDGRLFSFATGAETKGNARKTTGSYYTPESLVQLLLDSALEPVVAEAIAKHPESAAEALLSLTIVDPACGSGHFLLVAARRLAAHVARLHVKGTPSAADYRHALRQVVSRCIFGVDLNAMAVELCKVSLWMEAVEPGLPLSFLDSHIQHGNSLLGTTPELMAAGIPDAAWDPIEGDDKKIASALRKRNREAAAGQRGLDSLWSKPQETEVSTIQKAVVALDAAPDTDSASLASKATGWQAILHSATYRHQKSVADAWCSAFVWPKQPGQLAEAAPTNDLWRQIRDGQGHLPALATRTVNEMAARHSFFHWHLAFPQVFASGGFDVVLGNPPWERLKIEEQEFFASRNDAIATAPNAGARKKLIAALPSAEPRLWTEWCDASRRAEGESHFVRHSGGYPLCGKGDVNTYALFAEKDRCLRGPGGRAGFIVPTGIATDDSTKDFFAAIVEGRELVSLFDFQSGPGLFGDVGHARFKFALLTLGKEVNGSTLVFFARSAADVHDPLRRVVLAAGDFERLNPNTRNCPAFRSARDAEITKRAYERFPILWRDEGRSGPALNPWGVTIRRFLDMNKAETLALCSTSRSASGDSLPVFEAKLVHHFDHRFGDYASKNAESASTSLPDVSAVSRLDPEYSVRPRYWIGASDVGARVSSHWDRRWLLVWRDICRSFDERTVIATVIPLAGTDFTLRVGFSDAPAAVPAMLATLNSFAFDYIARQKLGGTHLSDYIIKQLPVPPPTLFSRQSSPWSPDETLHAWLLPRVLELTFTAWALESFARDVGYEGPPLRWDANRRFLLRAEIDAAFFHLYGHSRDDAGYILESFPIVRRDDEKMHGEYRTKRVILEIYDALAEAIRDQTPYETRLDPPPADRLVAHPPRSSGESNASAAIPPSKKSAVTVVRSARKPKR